MEFKEKLYKTNHKRAYYRARTFLMSFLVATSAAIAISVPTYISLNKGDGAMNSKAQENVTELSEEVLSYEN